MIKFQFFEKSNSLNCHFKHLGTFVVSIAHYQRAYFNYMALTEGTDFQLPGDASFLNCVQLSESQGLAYPLYAKIGCQHRDTYTSTKLQLIVYKDKQCSQPYENDDENKAKDGYYVGDYFVSNKVSFRPPFYSCQTCLPNQVSDTFSKEYTVWYDDEYIGANGQKAKGDGSEYYVKVDDINIDDQNNYFNEADDAPYVAQDDVVQFNYQDHDDAFYKMDDMNRRLLRTVTAKEGEVDASQSLTAKLMRKVCSFFC